MLFTRPQSRAEEKIKDLQAENEALKRQNDEITDAVLSLIFGEGGDDE